MSASVWRKVLIGNIFEMKVGGDLDLKSFSPYKESIYQFPIYSNGLEENGLYGYTSNPKFKKDSVTVTGRGTLGHAKYRNFDFDAIIRIIILEKKYEDINGYLISEIINFFKPFIFESTSIPQLTAPSVAKTRIYLPKDPEEQKHISDILSTCDTVIQNTQKTIDKYKAIKQGMMQDLFTRGLTKDGKLRPSYKEAPELYKESELGMIPKEWEIKALNEIYSKVTNAFVGTATPYYVESGHFYLESNNVKNGFINFNNKIFINDYFYEKQKNNLLHTGDLVMVQSGHVGHTAVIPEELNNTAAHAVIIIANPKIDASPYFYNYYFFSENAINMISKVTKGNTIKHILSSEMKNFKVCYPKMEEQLAIAKRLSSIDSTIQKEEAILEKYKNIKTGLMARLLTPPDDAEIIDETGETL